MTDQYRSPLLDDPLLNGRGAVQDPATGVAWHYGDPVGEQRALEAGGAVVDLSHYGVVRVHGPDRFTWLNSITTQELSNELAGRSPGNSAEATGLAPRTSTETLVLSPQGHIEHAAGVVDDGEATWLVTDSRRAARDLAAWLDSMKFMLSVQITDASEEFAAVGEPINAEGQDGEPVTWRDPWPEVAPGGTRYGPGDDDHPGRDRRWRVVLVARRELADAVRSRQESGWRLAGTWASEALRIEAWRPRFGSEVDHRSIPHELDWLRTAVHLHKGCYRGQETIARVHNLGRPPRRLVMLHLDGSGHLLPEPGAEVSVAGDGSASGPPRRGRSAGTVTSVARHHVLGPIALAVVKRSVPEDAVFDVACQGGEIRAGQQVIVPASGVSVDRPPSPASHGLTRGLTPRGDGPPTSLL